MTEFAAIDQELRHCRNPYVYRVFLFALETAMRRSELLALRWSDINARTGVASISMSKNGLPRSVPLTLKALSLVKDWRNNANWSANDHLFHTSPNGFRLAWERAVRRAGVCDLRFHDLRHEAISRFFEQGLSVPEVALISGHKDVRMLFRYTHLRAEDVAKKLSMNTATTPK